MGVRNNKVLWVGNVSEFVRMIPCWSIFFQFFYSNSALNDVIQVGSTTWDKLTCSGREMTQFRSVETVGSHYDEKWQVEAATWSKSFFRLNPCRSSDLIRVGFQLDPSRFSIWISQKVTWIKAENDLDQVTNDLISSSLNQSNHPTKNLLDLRQIST